MWTFVSLVKFILYIFFNSLNKLKKSKIKLKLIYSGRDEHKGNQFQDEY